MHRVASAYPPCVICHVNVRCVAQPGHTPADIADEFENPGYHITALPTERQRECFAHLPANRALKQNASAVVARAATGERVVITDNGRPVAQMPPLPDDHLTSLQNAGLLRPASRTVAEVDPPGPRRGRRALGDALAQMRDEDDR